MPAHSEPSSPRRGGRHRLCIAALLVALTACSGSDKEPSDVAATPADVLASPAIRATLAGAAGGPRMFLRCYGSGGPTVLLVAGSDSSGAEFQPSFLRPLAEQRTTCTYDRLGTGQSDPPPQARRTIDQVVADLQALLTAARLDPPYVLVGSSGGGNIAVQYALRHPADIAGLGLLDVPRANPELDKEFPGPAAWDNPEHLDWVAAEAGQARLTGPVGSFPLLVVTATGGQSDVRDQSFWLRLSPRAKQVELAGGHEIYRDDPTGVAGALSYLLTPRQ